MLTYSEFINEGKHFINLSSTDISKHLSTHGWKLQRTSGGHDVWGHDRAKHKIAVPRHRGDLAPGTVHTIIKQSTQFNKDLAYG